MDKVSPSPVIYVTDTNADLFVVDALTGRAMEKIGEVRSSSGAHNGMLAISPDGDLFMLSSGTLLTIDAHTAIASPITTTSTVVNNLAFAPDGTLYGVRWLSSGEGDDGLYTIDRDTGETALIVPLRDSGIRTALGAVFDADGKLYVSSSGLNEMHQDENEIIRVDISDGSATVVATTNGRLVGLAFLDGVLYGAETGGKFVRIDLDPSLSVADRSSEINLLGSYATSVFTDGPAAYFQLNESFHFSVGDSLDGSRTRDSSISGNPTDTPGKVGTAFEFDGDDSISFPNASELNPQSFTVEAWVLSDGPDGSFRAPVISQTSVGVHGFTSGFSLLQADTGRWEFHTGNGSTTSFNKSRPSGSSAAVVNDWTHLVGTVGRDDGGTLVQRFYVNGELVDEQNISQFMRNGLAELKFGAVRGAAGETSFFKGAVDEVAIYDSVLSAERIKAHYYDGLNTNLVISSPRSAAAISSFGTLKSWGPESGNRCGPARCLCHSDNPRRHQQRRS